MHAHIHVWVVPGIEPTILVLILVVLTISSINISSINISRIHISSINSSSTTLQLLLFQSTQRRLPYVYPACVRHVLVRCVC